MARRSYASSRSVCYLILFYFLGTTGIAEAQIPSGDTTPFLQSDTLAQTGVWNTYVRPSLGAIGAVIAAAIAGLFAYLNLLRKLRTQSRNAFLDMLVANPAYRNDLDRFLTLLHNKQYKDIQDMISNSPAIFFLFILKPELKADLKRELDNSSPNYDKLVGLVQKLFS